VIGQCPVTGAQLHRVASTLTDVAGLDRIVASWPGSFHLIASAGGRLRVQGTASGLRRVYHSGKCGVQVVASRADVLADLLGLDPDPALLALRLLDSVPHPLCGQPVWAGVDLVPPDHYLMIRHGEDSASRMRWWRPPDPTRPMVEGARELRQALREAVSARSRGGGTIACDFSGGLDSTPLCYLAAEVTADVVAFTMVNDDQVDDDPYWADLAAKELPTVTHVRYSRHDLPPFFADLQGGHPRMDEATIAMMTAPRMRARLQFSGLRGARLHFDGLGGDQLLTGHPARYHDLLRRRPLPALRGLRTYRALTKMSLPALGRTLLAGGSYRRWLAAATGQLANGRSGTGAQLFDWDRRPSLASWVTEQARTMIIDLLAGVGDAAEAVAPTRGAHADLHAVREAGRIVRLIHQSAECLGVAAASPFLDDRVVEACLAVRPEERVTPADFKPLMKAAMADVLPAPLLRRRTKGDGTSLAAEGFDENRAQLEALWEDSRLVRMGLVEPGPLRELVRLPYTPALHDAPLDPVLACELWLRSRERQPAGTARAGGGA
jgi:asparagine synthase (glutamine-hydrolysing)